MSRVSRLSRCPKGECLFPLIFSYNRCRHIMFESEEALADYNTAILLMILTLNS